MSQPPEQPRSSELTMKATHFSAAPWPERARRLVRRIEFHQFEDMAAHLDRWAQDALATPDEWHGVLVATREWLDYSARNQVLLASYGVDGVVAGPETWRLVPSTDPIRACAVRAGEHGYPVRVPVTTGGHDQGDGLIP